MVTANRGRRGGFAQRGDEWKCLEVGGGNPKMLLQSSVRTLLRAIRGGRIAGASSRGWKEQGRRLALCFMMEEV